MPEVKLSHTPLAGSLVLSLALPGVLALSMFARPYLGLPALTPKGDHGFLTNKASEELNLSQNSPAAPAAGVDSIRIECAQKEYKTLSEYRNRFQAGHMMRLTSSERRLSEETLAQYEDEYRCSYQQVTPEGCRRAHLPLPAALDIE